MTLFDTRPAIAATLTATAADLGVDFDVDRFLRELGPPLETMVGEQVPAETVPRFVDHYREIYERVGLPAARLMPGARESLAAVRSGGGESIVITGKNSHDARCHVRAADLDVVEVIGWAWADGKTDALKRHGAIAYAGDHPADTAAARAADAVAIAVTTGSHAAEDFPTADVVLPSLVEFPRWWDEYLQAQG